ncbi:MAG: MBL fold metallo-hydrolase [Promethearchaeota archaeon]
MIFKKIIVGPIGTNCYLFGSDITKEIVIIDPGGDPTIVINTVEKLKAQPIAVLLTHGHFDHSMKIGKILRHYNIPLMYNRKEYESGIYTNKEANRWLREGDSIKVGEILINILETPGHSPGGLCFYSKDVKELDGQKIDGIIFTGDLIFKGSVGRSDLRGGSQHLLFRSIKQKIMYNPELTDKFLLCPGHMGLSTIGEERVNNFFKQFFL